MNQLLSHDVGAIGTPPQISELNSSDATPVMVITPRRLEVEALSATLERAGVTVLSGSDSLPAAFAVLAARSLPSVALVDISLLTDNGLPSANLMSVLRGLTERAPQVRWILLDREPIELHIRQARLGGALAYVALSDTLQNLLAAVRSAQRSQLWFPESAAPLVPAPAGLGTRARRPNALAPLRERISPRETEVLGYLAQGLSVRQTAELIGLSPSTVDNHKSRLMKKLGIHKTVDLVRIALREGLIAH